jgi:hypothetical protein
MPPITKRQTMQINVKLLFYKLVADKSRDQPQDFFGFFFLFSSLVTAVSSNHRTGCVPLSFAALGSELFVLLRA